MPNANNGHYVITELVTKEHWLARHKQRLALLREHIDFPRNKHRRDSLQAEIDRRVAHLDEIADGKG